MVPFLWLKEGSTRTVSVVIGICYLQLFSISPFQESPITGATLAQDAELLMLAPSSSSRLHVH